MKLRAVGPGACQGGGSGGGGSGGGGGGGGGSGGGRGPAMLRACGQRGARRLERDHPFSAEAQHRPSARPSYIAPETLDACTLHIAPLTPMMLFQDDLAWKTTCTYVRRASNRHTFTYYAVWKRTENFVRASV